MLGRDNPSAVSTSPFADHSGIFLAEIILLLTHKLEKLVADVG